MEKEPCISWQSKKIKRTSLITHYAYSHKPYSQGEVQGGIQPQTRPHGQNRIRGDRSVTKPKSQR
jgi:hypothetical protein